MSENVGYRTLKINIPNVNLEIYVTPDKIGIGFWVENVDMPINANHQSNTSSDWHYHDFFYEDFTIPHPK
jgi:hypothetical protein